nr:restriction endonuclease [Acetobacter persici]
MSALSELLDSLRDSAVSESEKGTYFEELIVCYLRTEPSYADIYDQVCTYKEWAREHGHPVKDTGIDLVARTRGTQEFHAIQCKFYAPDHKISKKDIDTFFSASGKKHFSRRIMLPPPTIGTATRKIPSLTRTHLSARLTYSTLRTA